MFFKFGDDDIVNTTFITNPRIIVGKTLTSSLGVPTITSTGSVYLEKPYLNADLTSRTFEGFSEKDGGLIRKIGPFSASVDFISATRTGLNFRYFSVIEKLCDYYKLYNEDYSTTISGTQYNRIRIINIPEVMYDKQIATGTLTLEDEDYETGNIRRIADDGQGNLYTLSVSGTAQGQVVGKVFYQEGVAFLGETAVTTNASVYELFNSNSMGGISNLSSTLTVNSITVAPDLRYEGKDATSTSWPAVSGTTLSFTGSGFGTTFPPTASIDTPFLNYTDKAVRFSGGQYFSSNGVSTIGDISTEDFVLECVFTDRDIPGVANGLISKGRESPSTGYHLGYSGVDASASLSFYIISGGLGTSCLFTGTFPGAWYHVMVFADRNETNTNGLRMFVNGQEAANAGADPAGTSGSISTTQNFVIGGYGYTYFEPYNGNIAYASMWKQNNWFQGGASNVTEWTRIANERFGKLAGVFPTIFSGTIAMSSSRNSPAYLTKYSNNTGSLHLVGQFWPRLSQRLDISGNIKTGYLSENATTNYISASYLSSSWTAINVQAVPSASFYGIPAYSIIGKSAGANSQEVRLTGTFPVPPGGIPRTFSVYAKKADPSVAFIYLLPVAGVTSVGAWFNLHSGTVTDISGVIGHGTSAAIQSMGDGWFRCSVAITSSQQIKPTMGISTGSGNTITAVNNLTGAIVAGFQYETHVGVPTSYITYLTSANDTPLSLLSGSRSRAKDDLFFTSSLSSYIGKMSFDHFALNQLNTTGSQNVLTLNDNTFSNYDSINLGNTGTVYFQSIVSSAVVASATSSFEIFSDGLNDSLEVKYYLSASNVYRIKRNGTDNNTSQTTTSKPSVNKLIIGSSSLNALISNVVVENAVVGDPLLNFGAPSSNYRWKLDFRGEHRIPTQIFKCRAAAGELNASTNSTFYYTESSGTFKNAKLSLNTGSFVYVTSVGLYSDQYELVGLANIAQPIKKNLDEDILFRILLDR